MNVNRTLGLLLMMAIVAVTAMATPALAAEMTTTRTVSVTDAAPGDTFTVTVDMSFTGAAGEVIQAVQLEETMPSGWTVTEVNGAGYSFSGQTQAPVYAWQAVSQEYAPGDTETIVYTVTIPEGEVSGLHSISGQATGFVGVIPIGGPLADSSVNVLHNPITYISPGDSLQAAADAAEPGDTIMMAPGTYQLDTDSYGYAALYINKPNLTFMADGGEVIIGPGTGQYPAIYLGLDEDLNTYDASGTAYIGITFDGGLEDITYAESGSVFNDMLYENCILYNYPGGEVVLASNTITRNCTFIGTELSPGNDIVIENNTGNPSLLTYSSSGILIRNNSFSGGIIDVSGGNCIIEGNIFDGCKPIISDATSIFRENDVIGVNQPITSCQFYLNNFVDCVNVRNWGTPNTTSQATYTYRGATYTGYLGNYYSDYTGTDSNGDGVGEDVFVPYIGNNDTFPLMGTWDAATDTIINDAPDLSFVPEAASVIEGQETEIQIMVSAFPEGLSGYNLTVDIVDPTVAEIVDIEYPAWASITDNSSMPGSAIYLKAVDGGSAVQAGAEDVVLATLTVSGKKFGSTGLTLNVEGLDDDSGNPIYAFLSTGALEVTLTPVPGETLSSGDLNDDGLYEDLTGDGTFSFVDVEVFFNNKEWIEATMPLECSDFNGNSRIDFDDVVKLFEMV